MSQLNVECPVGEIVQFTFNKNDTTVNAMCAICHGIATLDLNKGKPTGGSGLCQRTTPARRFTVSLPKTSSSPQGGTPAA